MFRYINYIQTRIISRRHISPTCLGNRETPSLNTGTSNTSINNNVLLEIVNRSDDYDSTEFHEFAISLLKDSCDYLISMRRFEAWNN